MLGLEWLEKNFALRPWHPNPTRLRHSRSPQAPVYLCPPCRVPPMHPLPQPSRDHWPGAGWGCWQHLRQARGWLHAIPGATEGPTAFTMWIPFFFLGLFFFFSSSFCVVF